VTQFGMMSLNNPQPNWRSHDGVAGQGGVGKSYFTLELAISAATGKTLFPSFRPVRSMKVVLFMGEDLDIFIAKRLMAIQEQFSSIFTLDEELQQAWHDGRLKISAAKPFPLMDHSYGQVRKSSEFNSMCEATKGADMIVIDPLSKFHGLPSENENAHVSKLMNAFQEVTNQNGALLLFTHHTRKGTAKADKDELQGAARGASAIIDESRFALVLQPASSLKEFPFPDHDKEQCITATVIKSNYTQRSPEAILLCRNESGVLSELSIHEDRIQRVAMAIRAYLMKGKLKLPKSDFIKGAGSGDFKDALTQIQSEVGGKSFTRDVREGAVEWGINNGVLIEEDDPGSTRNPRKLISAGSNSPKLSQESTGDF